MKRTAAALILFTAFSALLFARNYRLEQEESVNLSGIDRVEFDLRGVNCALCVRTIAVSSELFGDRTDGSMKLTLNGRISSNRPRAVPEIIIERTGNAVLVRLYSERGNFFGLSQSGRAGFTAHLPSRFTGELSAAGSSGDINAEVFNLETMEIRSSSGDITVQDIRAGTIALSVSSGDVSGSTLESRGDLIIESSSGDITMERISGEAVSLKASSGDIEIDDTRAENQVRIRVSSGDALLGSVISRSAELKISSGKLRIDSLDSQETQIDISSGSTVIGSARGGLDLNGGSGKTLIGMEALERPVRIDAASGSVELRLPPEAGFDARLSTRSGSIRSDFEIIGGLLGDKGAAEGRVNGGGPPVEIRSSSGSIKLKFR